MRSLLTVLLMTGIAVAQCAMPMQSSGDKNKPAQKMSCCGGGGCGGSASSGGGGGGCGGGGNAQGGANACGGAAKSDSSATNPVTDKLTKDKAVVASGTGDASTLGDKSTKSESAQNASQNASENASAMGGSCGGNKAQGGASGCGGGNSMDDGSGCGGGSSAGSGGMMCSRKTAKTQKPKTTKPAAKKK